MKKLLRIKVKGKVQGVWFRKNTKLKAEELKIAGLVRNEPDRSVFIEAEGEESDLQVFLEWCKKGPEFARVDDILIEKGRVKNYTDFQIQY